MRADDRLVHFTEDGLPKERFFSTAQVKRFADEMLCGEWAGQDEHNRIRGVAQLGQSAAFGTQRSPVQIQSPRFK